MSLTCWRIRWCFCVSMHPHSWSILEVTLLMFLNPLMPMLWRNKKVRWLAMVVELAICSLPLFRTGAVSHDLSYDRQVQLIIAHLSEGGSEWLVVFQLEQHGAWCVFLGPKSQLHPWTLWPYHSPCSPTPSSLLSHCTPQTKVHSLGWPRLSSAVSVVFYWSLSSGSVRSWLIIYTPQIVVIVYYSIVNFVIQAYSCLH